MKFTVSLTIEALTHPPVQIGSQVISVRKGQLGSPAPEVPLKVLQDSPAILKPFVAAVLLIISELAAFLKTRIGLGAIGHEAPFRKQSKEVFVVSLSVFNHASSF